MNILLLAPTPPPTGGIARWTETVIKYCKQSKGVTLFHINTGNKVKSIVKRTTFERFVFSTFRIKQIINKINRICRENNICVAHITTSGGFGMIRDYYLIKALKRNGVKSIYHLHFGRVSTIYESNNFECKLLNRVMKMVDAVIAMDPQTFNLVSNKYNSFFVPNPIDEIDYNYSNKHQIVFVGYVVKEKGIVELYQAWNALCNKYPDWSVEVIGPYESSFINELKSLHCIPSFSFVGELPHDETIRRVQMASVLVLPSYSEGFPYSICEAMFAGKAIIGSSVGAIPFLLDDECGLLCKERDVESLKNALSLMIEDELLRKKYGSNAAQKARKTFTVDRVLEQYKNIWEKVAKE